MDNILRIPGGFSITLADIPAGHLFRNGSANFYHFGLLFSPIWASNLPERVGLWIIKKYLIDEAIFAQYMIRKLNPR